MPAEWEHSTNPWTEKTCCFEAPSCDWKEWYVNPNVEVLSHSLWLLAMFRFIGLCLGTLVRLGARGRSLLLENLARQSHRKDGERVTESQQSSILYVFVLLSVEIPIKDKQR
jgi:hypothetical protein